MEQPHISGQAEEQECVHDHKMSVVRYTDELDWRKADYKADYNIHADSKKKEVFVVFFNKGCWYFQGHEGAGDDL